MKTKTYHHDKYRFELHSRRWHDTGNAPNCKPVLKIFHHDKFSAEGDQPVAEVVLYDFLDSALLFYEGYLKHDLELKRTDRKFKSLLKRGRRGLGYSYP